MTYLRNQRLNSWNFFRFYDVSHFMPFIESLTHGQLLNVVSGVKAFYGYSATTLMGSKSPFIPIIYMILAPVSHCLLMKIVSALCSIDLGADIE